MLDVLPTVMLGLRASIREDIKTLKYGTSVGLPGDAQIDFEV